jgi:hypothetical protein
MMLWIYDPNQLRIEPGNWLEYGLGSNDIDMTKPNKRIDPGQSSYLPEAFFLVFLKNLIVSRNIFYF